VFQRSIISCNRYRWGLGNRVRAVLGASSLAEVEHRQLLQVWPTGGEFGPRLTDLWQFSAPVLPGAVSRALAPVWPYRDHTLDWLTDERRSDLVWQIRTPHALDLPPGAVPWGQRLRTLQPTAGVADRVAHYFGENLQGKPYVGVMIRAHQRSHGRTLQSSPVEWFVDRMRLLAQDLPGVAFFISCDVAEVAQQVVAAVPGAVAQTDKGPYNSVTGVQAAVADLYLLASSGYILGPHWSSFVDMAEQLAGGILTMETPVEIRGSGQFVGEPARDPLAPWAR
jgi:hypothetical protein